jgi:putative polymerase
LKTATTYPLAIEFGGSARAAYSPRAVTLLLFAATAYLGVLSAINAHVLRASPALVGLVEAMIYAACFAQIARSLTPRLVLSWLVIAAALVLLWLIRQEPDIKGLRDLIIPMLFFALGRHVSDVRFADRVLLGILSMLVVVGIFEALAVDAYASVFQTFSFYVNLGSIDAASAMFEGQTLTLNGYRPEGIGRTLLPWLLGSHRVSSLLMDPVSLGNFAVITVGWALSKTGKDEGSRLWLLLGAATLLVLADSRFGTFGVIVMVAARFLPVSFVDRGALLVPVLAASATVGVALLAPSYGDNLVGRLTGSGQVLFSMPPAEWLGVHSPMPGYADMGYAYVLTRFGFPLMALLFFGLFLTGQLSHRAQYFRAFAILYASMILAVSGSSLFALKTAGVLWFLMGVASTDRPAQEEAS